MKKLVAFAIALSVSFCFADYVLISADNAYAKATPPNVKNSAVFMDITNNMPKAVRLISVSTDASQSAELHTHKHEDGMMKMVQIDSIEVPAEGSVSLKPGGLHIMLMDVKKPIKAGDKVNLTLKFSDGRIVDVIDIPVKNLETSGHAH